MVEKWSWRSQAQRCIGCGWLFSCMAEQEDRMYCLACTICLKPGPRDDVEQRQQTVEDHDECHQHDQKDVDDLRDRRRERNERQESGNSPPQDPGDEQNDNQSDERTDHGGLPFDVRL
jgi:hypothetical protein